MRHVFVAPDCFGADPIVLTGAAHHHLVHVLRAKPGETLVALDGAGRACYAEICAVGRSEITLRHGLPADLPAEPPVVVVVCQAIGRGDRFEDVLQHGTEAGASGFVPLLSERGIVRIDPRDTEGKLARWSRIVCGAAEQSRRSRLPSVSAPVTVSQAAGRVDCYALALVAALGARDLATVLPLPGTPQTMPASVLLVVGPEGGLTDGEVELLRAAGAIPASLGPHTLRTETAAVVAISRILHHASMLDAVLGAEQRA